MYSLKFSTILLFLPILITIITSDPPDPPAYLGHNCYDETATNYTSNSTYKSNLDLLLSWLSSNATRNDINGFYSTSAGQDQVLDDIVYGLFFCRGEITIKFCQDCVTLAAENVVQRCPTQQMAIIWYDICTLRYSNSNMSSTMATEPGFYMGNPGNLSVDARFTDLLMTSLSAVVTEVAKAPSGAKKFAVHKVLYTWFQTLYTLAECTPDLSSSDCNGCLQEANLTSVERYFSNKGAGARVMYPSCNLRFELHPFYNETATAAMVPSPAPSVLLPPPPPSAPSRVPPGPQGRSSIFNSALL